jgi:hypothetical protein
MVMKLGPVKKNETENSTLCWYYFYCTECSFCFVKQYQYKAKRDLRRRSTAARLLRSWVRIPPRAVMFVCCECCVLSGRGLCDGLIIRSEESYRLWRVAVFDQVTSYAKRLKPDRGLQNTHPLWVV